MKELPTIHLCPNCKQVAIHLSFSEWKKGKKNVRCTRCKCRVDVSFGSNLSDQAPGHEEHSSYDVNVTLKRKKS